MTLSVAALDRARRDAAVFADVLVGQPLWDHQLEVVRSPARYRVLCAGRRAGKTRVFGVLSLHQAFAVPGSKVLIVSAGDTASKRMFADIAGMAAAAPLLAGSVSDETKSLLILSSGSVIECVPASMAQIRSAEADLLIVDEAAFVAQEIWEAAEPTVLARPGSRVLICSTPWSGGGGEHFFRVLWSQGMASPSDRVESWHWPSTVSPMVDEALLDDIRERSAPDYFAREYMAEWTDEVGSYFTSVELDRAATVDELVPPGRGRELGGVVGGVDWGFSRDANTLVVVAARAERDAAGRVRFWVPWLAERFRLPYSDWIDEVLEVAGGGFHEGFCFQRLVCETNAVGAMPSEVLARRMAECGRSGVVVPVTTTAQLKQDAFGYMKLLLQQGRLELPREPALLKQLRALTFEQLPGGGVRIAVPERSGHDDLAMALCLALTAVMGNDFAPAPAAVLVTDEDLFGDEWAGGEGGWSIAPY